MTKNHNRIEEGELYFEFIRLYILHRASIEPIFTPVMVEKLYGHGWKLSTGSVSQLLVAMQRKGYIEPAWRTGGSQPQKTYRTTRQGRAVLKRAGESIRALFAKLV